MEVAEKSLSSQRENSNLSHVLRMFLVVDWGSLSEDEIDRLIVEGEREIGVWRMVQMAAIGERKRRKWHQVDGVIGRSWIYVALRPGRCLASDGAECVLDRFSSRGGARSRQTACLRGDQL
jgi:hypothetical protein